MDDVFLGEVIISLQNLLHVGTGISLCEPFLNNFTKVWVAKLSDDVRIVLGGEDIMKGEDMRKMFELLENFNFAIEQYPIDLVL